MKIVFTWEEFVKIAQNAVASKTEMGILGPPAFKKDYGCDGIGDASPLPTEVWFEVSE